MANTTPWPRGASTPAAKQRVDAAGYGQDLLAGPDDVQRAMTSVGQAAKTYLPQSVAAYLPSASSSSLETDPDLAPPHPPFLPELRILSTGAQAASLLPPRVDCVATTSTSAALSDAVHTSSAISPRPVPPLSPADTDPNFEQAVPTLPATLAESPAQLSSSSLSLSPPSAQSKARLYRRTRS